MRLKITFSKMKKMDLCPYLFKQTREKENNNDNNIKNDIIGNNN